MCSCCHWPFDKLDEVHIWICAYANLISPHNTTFSHCANNTNVHHHATTHHLHQHQNNHRPLLPSSHQLHGYGIIYIFPDIVAINIFGLALPPLYHTIDCFLFSLTNNMNFNDFQKFNQNGLYLLPKNATSKWNWI